MSYGFGLTIEALVAILLLLTILYCARLNKQIEKLKADEKLMKASVAELVMATERAERAIAGLKLTATEADSTLGARLREAEAYCKAMASSLSAGEDVLTRLRKIANAGRILGSEAAQPEPVAPAPDATGRSPDVKSVAAAAQAFAERARVRAHGRAA
ncbi:DUF6468 domain-containing protein [Pseudorhodoplanes sp.]|uniref:DUF6468 domain-containing protein n=1 Tax=Pseudorhodoplanes sp. TaxID=1934341 RepID=UPI0039195735